jgi:predicted nuclease with RNAse H fold
MHYCGVVAARGLLQLAMLEEVRAPEPPIRLDAVFFEPGSPRQVASELRALGEVVVAIGAPMTEPRGTLPPRGCDEDLRRRGVPPQPWDVHARELYEGLAGMGAFAAPDVGTGPVPEGSFREAPVFETNADGVFCALGGRRLPAKRHPLGMRLRIEELEHDHVVDSGGELWDRRIEEIDAAGAALCAQRYAVGHACWVGGPGEGTVVLPGSSLPERFGTAGVLPPVERLQLPPVD